MYVFGFYEWKSGRILFCFAFLNQKRMYLKNMSMFGDHARRFPSNESNEKKATKKKAMREGGGGWRVVVVVVGGQQNHKYPLASN